jgi:hypothetical protein
LALVVMIAKVRIQSPDAGSLQFFQMPARPNGAPSLNGDRVGLLGLLTLDRPCISDATRRSVDLATDRERTTQGKMKRTFLLATAALGALTIIVNARDDRLPAKFVGNWCLAEHTADHLSFYRRGRCTNPDK